MIRSLLFFLLLIGLAACGSSNLDQTQVSPLTADQKNYIQKFFRSASEISFGLINSMGIGRFVPNADSRHPHIPTANCVAKTGIPLAGKLSFSVGGPDCAFEVSSIMTTTDDPKSTKVTTENSFTLKNKNLEVEITKFDVSSTTIEDKETKKGETNGDGSVTTKAYGDVKTHYVGNSKRDERVTEGHNVEVFDFPEFKVKLVIDIKIEDRRTTERTFTLNNEVIPESEYPLYGFELR